MHPRWQGLTKGKGKSSPSSSSKGKGKGKGKPQMSSKGKGKGKSAGIRGPDGRFLSATMVVDSQHEGEQVETDVFKSAPSTTIVGEQAIPVNRLYFSGENSLHTFSWPNNVSLDEARTILQVSQSSSSSSQPTSKFRIFSKCSGTQQGCERPVECVQASRKEVEGRIVPKWVTAPGWYRQCAYCGNKDVATLFHINQHIDEGMADSFAECELPEVQPAEFIGKLNADMERTVDEPWTKCSEFGGCTIYTTGDFPEDSEWGLEDTGIFPLPGHTPSYVFQLVKQGIEGSIDAATDELAHYLDQAELLNWYQLKKEKLEEKTSPQKHSIDVSEKTD
jgi:hypothetical protein